MVKQKKRLKRDEFDKKWDPAFRAAARQARELGKFWSTIARNLETSK